MSGGKPPALGAEKPPALGAEKPIEEKAAEGVAHKAAEEKVVQHYAPPDEELPPPTFRQALIGYGSILLALVVLGLIVGLLMKVLR